MMRNRLLFLFAVMSLMTITPLAQAGSPHLTRVSPPGGQRGTTVTVELTGSHLEDARDLLFYEPGITFEKIEHVKEMAASNGRTVPVPEGTRVKVQLKIDEKCALGPHGFRVRTADGLTEYRRFFVGPYPSIEEDETTQKRNDQRETAIEVPVNSTVYGRLNEAADVDFYKITVKKGQRISAELEAARLGVDRGIPDLYLACYDAQGKQLASVDDSALFLQDPVFSILAPADGTYFVEARHGMYNGSGYEYRLHIGTFSRPTGLYPAGGPVGEELKVTILGDPKGAWSQIAKLPNTPGELAFLAKDDGGSAPSPNTLRVSPFPNVLETEPNDTPEAAAKTSAVSAPIAFNGIIEKPGDVDCFIFRAKKGERFRVHALANALGSPVDPAIWIRPLEGRTNAMVRATDSRPNQLGYAPSNGLNRESLDPVIEFAAIADGLYVVGIEDERNEGGADYVYRIEVTQETGGIYTYIAPEPDNQNNPQLRQSIVVAPGNRWTSQIALFSTDRTFNGELELVGVNLPEGVTITAPRIKPGMTRVPVVFTASVDAKPQAALIDLVARPVGSDQTAMKSGYRQTILMNQYGNNDYYLHCPVEKLALAITESAPFSVEVEQPKTSLVQNGEMRVKFKVNRKDGYDGSVTVQMDWRPGGIFSTTPVTLKGDETEGEYLLGASRNASAGEYSVVFTAVSGRGGRTRPGDGTDRTHVASQPFTLTISEPHVEARIARTSIERGKTATLTCRLNHLQKFEGKAKATLARLPRGVALVDPFQEISSEDKEVTFTLRATNEALVGNYTGVTMDLTVIEKGQAVRQLSGYGILRVDAERGVKPKK